MIRARERASKTTFEPLVGPALHILPYNETQLFLSWPSDPFASWHLETSTDLVEWSPATNIYWNGYLGGQMSRYTYETYTAPSLQKKFFRIKW